NRSVGGIGHQAVDLDQAGVVGGAGADHAHLGDRFVIAVDGGGHRGERDVHGQVCHAEAFGQAEHVRGHVGHRGARGDHRFTHAQHEVQGGVLLGGGESGGAACYAERHGG